MQRAIPFFDLYCSVTINDHRNQNINFTTTAWKYSELMFNHIT